MQKLVGSIRYIVIGIRVSLPKPFGLYITAKSSNLEIDGNGGKHNAMRLVETRWSSHP